MSALIGLAWAVGILGVIGLIRAVGEFGVPGLVAFAKLNLAPTALVLGFFIIGPLGITRWDDSGRRSFLPPKRIWKRTTIVVGIITCATLVLSAIVGVGWAVTK
jgi:hypothetical protein